MISEEQIQDIIDSDDTYSRYYFVWQMDPDNTGGIEQFYIDEIEPDLDEAVLALMQHTGDYYSDAERAINNSNWYVLTDDEADERCIQYAEEVLDSLFYDMDKSLRYYFDEDRYIEDYLESGRGTILSGSNGEEHEETINGTTYFIYRQ